MERGGLLRHVVAHEVRFAVLAGLGVGQVLEAAARTPSSSASRPPSASTRRSTSRRRCRTRARSPWPDLATAAVSWSSRSWSWVGRLTDRRTPDRDRVVRPRHPRQHEREVRLGGGLVVDQEVRLGHAVLADRHDLGMQAREADALVAVLAEDHRLAVLEDEHPVLADLAVGEVAPRPVVEDVAVLEDLDERGALVAAGPLERALEMLGVRVDRAGDEARLGGERDRQRDDRRVDRARPASTWSACRTPRSARPGPWSARRSGC